ncbi:hypothetical protein PMAYCL1PPCAC_16101, partial [Pristionchus mayeri]
MQRTQQRAQSRRKQLFAAERKSSLPLLDADVFLRRELIGAAKVNVADQQVDVLSLARTIATAKRLEGNEDAFMIYNMDALYDRYELWMRELPHVQPFYAVKCNNDEVILQTLVALGAGFDCASSAEIDTILRMGAPPERILFANTCKPPAFVAHASDVGVNRMTFDNANELVKIAEHHDNPQLILRIAASDPTARNPLGLKFGADPIKVAPGLIKRAAEMDLPIAGISFHVGSGCNDPQAFRIAIRHVRSLLDIGRALGHPMEVVDIGGGFPGDEDSSAFEMIASVIRSAIDEYFPEPDIRFIAEPGRFFAARPCTLVTSVIARTTIPADKITKNAADAARDGIMYYINDGAYGSFSSLKSDSAHPVGRPLFDQDGELYPSIIWGPTCDSKDKIEDQKEMRALEVGDCMIYEDMGAYTTATTTSFNGFTGPTTIYVVGERTWYAI